MSVRTSLLALLSFTLLTACGEAEMPEVTQPDFATEEAFPGKRGSKHEGYHLTSSGPVWISWEEIDGERVLDGDILLSPNDLIEVDPANNDLAVLRSGLAARPVNNRWPSGIIPYRIDSTVADPTKVTAAIAHWEQNTVIRFVPYEAQTSYVTFRGGGGCSSYVGRIGGQQYITLASACSTGNIIHEIGHAIGLYHENSRADRDRNLRVNWANITSGAEHNFKTYLESGYAGSDVGPYDFGSIMHYSSYSFSSNGQPTLVRLDETTFGANRAGLSPADLSGIATLYGPTTTEPDITPPQVAITSPAASAQVSGTVTLTASASDNVGIARVDFFVGGALLGTRTASPYSISWNSTTVANGSHSLTARASDAAGNVRTSTAVTVNVQNSAADTTAPNVAITSPTAGSQISGTVTLAASASDNVGVTRVEFFVNGVLVGSRTLAPWSISWDSKTVPNGNHVVTARARDAAGNITTSAPVTVSVVNLTVSGKGRLKKRP